MRAKSIHGKSPEELQLALNDSLKDGFSATLAIVFVSIDQEREVICTFLQAKGIDVFGLTSSGEFIDGHQSQGEIVILLLDIRRDYYTLIFNDVSSKALRGEIDAAITRAKSTFSRPSFIVGTTCIDNNGSLFNGADFIHDLERAMGAPADIFGGMAGADGRLVPSWVFTHAEATNEGFVLLVLDSDKIKCSGVALSGWKPLGITRTVTSCDNEWLYSIDEKPALDMYLKYLGQSVSTEVSESFLEEISIFHPFFSLDGDDPELRTPIFIDRDKNAIRLDYPIPEGGKFQFTMPPDFDIVETVLDHAKSVRELEGTNADTVLVFSCLGRWNALGPMATQENEGLHKIWNAPMAGFFTYGEYGKDPAGKNRLHSTTCSWVAISEKV